MSLTVTEAGALGGKATWKKKTKKQRSKAMKSLADKRWAKRNKSYPQDGLQSGS
mgnify:CR=1 FL=1